MANSTSLTTALRSTDIRRTAPASEFFRRNCEFGNSRLASRKGSQWACFEFNSAKAMLVGKLVNGRTLSVTVTEAELDLFLEAPIRLRGQAMRNLIVAKNGAEIDYEAEFADQIAARG